MSPPNSEKWWSKASRLARSIKPSSAPNPSQIQAQFEKTRSALAAEIDRKIVLPSNESGTLDDKWFLPHGEARLVFLSHKSDVVSLFVRNGSGDDGNRFYEAVVASDVIQEDRENSALSNILALLIDSGTHLGSEEWRGFERLVNSGKTSRDICDKDLPLDRATIEKHFGQARAKHLYSAQFHFCPVILCKDVLLTLKPQHILPFLETDVNIGEGSHGKVYKVKVAQRHFCLLYTSPSPRD